MERNPHKAWGVILAWSIANLLGVAGIGAVTLLFPFLATIRGTFVSSLIIGLPIGIAQWVALRRYARISWLWILTIPVALLLQLQVATSGVLGGIWGFVDDESVLFLTAGYATLGMLVGLLQWFLLRGRFARSIVWILSSSVGLGLGTGLVLATNLVDQSGLLSILLVVLVYATATGSTLSWMLVPEIRIGGQPANAT